MIALVSDSFLKRDGKRMERKDWSVRPQISGPQGHIASGSNANTNTERHGWGNDAVIGKADNA